MNERHPNRGRAKWRQFMASANYRISSSWRRITTVDLHSSGRGAEREHGQINTHAGGWEANTRPARDWFNFPGSRLVQGIFYKFRVRSIGTTSSISNTPEESILSCAPCIFERLAEYPVDSFGGEAIKCSDGEFEMIFASVFNLVVANASERLYEHHGRGNTSA